MGLFLVLSLTYFLVLAYFEPYTAPEPGSYTPNEEEAIPPFVKGMLACGPLLLVLTVVTTMREGLIIDHEKKKYRAYLEILAIRFKPWRKLPLDRKLMLLRKEERFAANMGWVTTGARYKSFYYEVRLIFPKIRDHVVVVKCKNLQRALHQGIYMSQFIALPLKHKLS